MKHLAIVAALVVAVTALVGLGLRALPLLPVEASAQAVPIDRLFGKHFLVIAFLFALIVVFLLYSVIVFRRKAGETGDGDYITGHTGLEVAWTVAPLATVLYFAYLGAGALAETRRVDPTAMEVNVTASQWSWSYEYPDFGVTSTSLNLPVDRQVLLRLTSTDVIHSFWVPEFRVKQDALPGENMVRELRITPTLLGEYKARCAELCGRQHAYMESPVVVMAQADFDQWIAEQTTVSADPVERGAKWAAQFGCTACHSVDGTTIVGPTWKGLYGQARQLADGASITADEAYLRNSILDPNLQVVKGFPANVMPANFGERLSDEQIGDIIAYIQSLK